MASIGRVLLIPKGDYSSSATYNNLDWVRYGGKAWVCKVDGTVNVTPVQGDTWQLLAQDGSGGGGGASDWDDISYKPFDTIDTTTDFEVDNLDNNKLHIKRDTFGTMRIVSGGSTTDLEASGDSIFRIDAGTNVSITADDSSNPKKITINSTGGGGGLSNAYDKVTVGATTISASGASTLTLTAGSNITLTPNTSDKSVTIAASGGGHTMIDNTTLINSMNTAITEGTSNDDVVSAYGVGTWSDVKEVVYAVHGTSSNSPIGTGGVGTWDDTFTTQTDWLYIAELSGILSNPNKHVEIVIDPDYFTGNVPVFGGWLIDDSTCKICIKFANEISDADCETGVVGVKITTDRTAVSWINGAPT